MNPSVIQFIKAGRQGEEACLFSDLARIICKQILPLKQLFPWIFNGR